MIELLFLVGPIAAVPLGLAILRRSALNEREGRLLEVALWMAPLAALAALGVLASFTILPGRLAAGLTIPWLLFSAYLAVIAVVRLFDNGWRFPAPLCRTAALLYLPVGAAWLYASRLGINPGGFGEPIVLLTAVHFHFSGFAASVIAAEVVDRAPDYPKARAWVALGAVLGTPLIAAGFVFSPPLKAGAIVFFSTTLATSAVVQWLHANREERSAARRLLKLSSFSILVGMALAVTYGISDYLGWPWISIPQMANTHGILNALGFTLCGLAGWLLAGPNIEAPKVEEEIQNG